MVCLITCLNERPAISRIMLNTFDRLTRASGSMSEAVACVHTDEDENLCRRYGVRRVRTPDNIAGRKWNAALKHALEETSCSHFLLLGDDDSISTDGFRTLVHFASKGFDYVGFNKNYFVDTASGEAFSYTQKYTNKLIGAGALISRRAIEQTTEMCLVKCVVGYAGVGCKILPGENYRLPLRSAHYLAEQGFVEVLMKMDITDGLWPEKGNGLDHAREMRLTLAGFAPMALAMDTIHVTDFKSANNIWPFERVKMKWPGPPATLEEATWYMTEKEKAYISKLIKQQ